MEEDGVDGEARYQAFKNWFETVLLNDPSILTKQTDMSSYVTTVPTKIEPLAQMVNAKDDESLIRDVYLSNGQHVARICSEFIPIINPTKRINVIYPMVNGKCRYNLGIFTGDEQSYPAKVSWGWAEDPSTPVITSMSEYGKGLHNVAYLRGNHMTLETDPKFKDSDYATTNSKSYTLILNDAGGKVEYPLVKINEYVYTHRLYRARTYQNGATQMSERLYKKNNTYSTWGDLESMMSCPALAVDPDNGTVAMTYYKAQPPVHMNDVQFKDNNYYPESIRNKGDWNNYAKYGNPVGYLKTVYDRVADEKNHVDWIGNHLCYPMIICQQVAK